MNYIKELNAFRDWLFFHPLPTNAIVLWHALMMVNNAMGWVEKIQVPCTTIETLSGLKKQRLYEARKALVEAGLIRYEAGNIGEAATYEIMPFEKEKVAISQEQENNSNQHDTDLEDVPEMVEEVKRAEIAPEQTSTDPSNRLFGPNPLLLPDHSRYQRRDPFSDENRHIIKLKQKQKRRRGRRDARKDPFFVYEQNVGMLPPISRESLIAWCDDLGDDVVIYGIEKATKHGARTFAYLEQILREWANAKLTNLEEVLVFEQQKKQAKKKRNQQVQPSIQEKKSLFDELREGDLNQGMFRKTIN